MPARSFRRGDRVILIHDRSRDDEQAPDAAAAAVGAPGTPDPVFVLVHGLGMGHLYWGDLVDQLAQTGRVLALDLPGFGDSPRPRTVPTIPESADLLVAMLRSEGLDHPVLIGHSSGAQVVAEVAARHPELVDRIVLIGPSVNPQERTVVQQAARFVQDVAVIDPTALEAGARAYAETGLGWVTANLRPMLEHRMEHVLPRVRAETLVIRGEKDRVVPRSWAEAVASLVPHARYAELADRGHEATARRDGPLHELIAAHAHGEPAGRTLALHERRAALSKSLGGGGAARVGWVLRDYAYGARRRLDQLAARRPPSRWRHGDPTRPDVVLLTGLHEHWSFLAPLADALNRAGHRITIVHGLGMNRRPVPETSHRLQVALDRVAPPPAGRVLVGHSKGGLIAKHLLTDLERGTGPLGVGVRRGEAHGPADAETGALVPRPEHARVPAHGCHDRRTAALGERERPHRLDLRHPRRACARRQRAARCDEHHRAGRRPLPAHRIARRPPCRDRRHGVDRRARGLRFRASSDAPRPVDTASRVALDP